MQIRAFPMFIYQAVPHSVPYGSGRFGVGDAVQCRAAGGSVRKGNRQGAFSHILSSIGIYGLLRTTAL